MRDAARLTCREAIELMADYLETALGPEVVGALERHLRDCRPCLAYLETYRKTRSLAATAERVEMPPEMKTRLRQFLRDRLGRSS